jgi:hypothetical protein
MKRSDPMPMSSKPETSGTPTPVETSADETQSSKHACWSGERCSSRFSVSRLFWRRRWSCDRGESPTTTNV